MQLTDLAVLKQLKHWLAESQPVWLCTIVSTYGSAPRPVGSLFASNGKQRVGSISGGCLEQAFFEKLVAGDFQQQTVLFDYNSQLNRSGQPSELPCGGSIELLVERLEPSHENINHISQWLKLAEHYHPFERTINLGTAAHSLITLSDSPKKEVERNADAISLRYAQVWSILLLGISQVSEHVARIALSAGYQVRICDNREEMADAWNYTADQGGIDIEWTDPGLFIEKYSGPRSAVLALAHDPRVDDIGLMTAFGLPSYYLGAMGSQATTLKRRERLQRICQFDDATLDRLHAPIGLDIGSKTPVEIAISIMAALIQAKANTVV